ncbi:MAG: hypothetical protein NBV77_04980 [Bacteroidia bacterium]|nr:hypothetical protein [Bacteroidia bacterium]
MTSWKFNVSVWLSLFLLAILFAWERTLYADSAYTLFNVLNGFPAVEHFRLTQQLNLLPAQIGVLLQLPIRAIAILLSLTPLIWAFAATWYSTIHLKNVRWSFYFLGIFLVTGPEFQFLGTAEMILALIFGGLFAMETRKSMIFLWAILAYLAHPGILPALLAASLFQKQIKFPLIAITSSVVFKVLFIPSSGYENQILSNLLNISNVFQSWGWHYFYTSLFGGWALPYLVVFIAGLVAFLGQQRWLYFSTTALTAFFITYLYQDGDSGMMMQKSYAPLWLILALPLLHAKESSVFKKLLLISFFGGCFYVCKQAKFHIQRQQELEKRISKMPIESKKIITTNVGFPADIYGIPWAIPYETLIYSTHLNPEKPITICISDSSSLKELISNKKPLGKNEFRGASFAFPLKQKSLNQRYFSTLSTDAYSIE